MNGFPLTPGDIAALRVLLKRAKKAGWEPAGVERAKGNGYPQAHTWRRGGFDVAMLYADSLDFQVAAEGWQCPALSVATVTAVLELAGALDGAAA